MATGTFEYQSEEERRSIELAIAFVTEMRQLALVAPSGQVLDICEGQAVEKGRALLLTTLEQAVQARIAQGEEKGVGTHLRVRGAAPPQTPVSPRSADRPGSGRGEPLSCLLRRL